MKNNYNNFTPPMSMWGNIDSNAACAPMQQTDIMMMFIQLMSMMTQGQIPQKMVQTFLQMMQQMNISQCSQPQSDASSPTTPLDVCKEDASKEANENPKDLESEFLTVKQVAQLLHVNEVTLWRWHKKDILKRHKVGYSRILYKRKDVYDYINSHNNVR